jgi:hypothetical protein
MTKALTVIPAPIPPPPPPPKSPKVDNRTAMAALRAEALTRLSEVDTLYTDASRLTEIIIDGDNITKEPMTRQRITYLMQEHLDWEHKYVVMTAHNIMQHRHFRDRFRPLKDIYRDIVFRPDFSLVTGYDHVTESYCHRRRSLASHQFNGNATHKDAVAAYEKICYLFEDFPFVMPDEDKASLVAFMLTVLCRSALNCLIPVLAIDANRPSAGKTLLSQIMYRVLFGSELSVLAEPHSKGEWEKRIAGLLKSPEKIACIDNIKGFFNSEHFASAVTARVIKIRVLGATPLYDMENNLAFILNANDLKLDSDISQRVYWTKLHDTRADTRDQNKFQVWEDHGMSLQDYIEVEDNRVEYLDALMTMILAWRNAGRPERNITTLAKYGTWERKVGGMMEFSGAASFLASHEQRATAADYDLSVVLQFIERVMTKYGAAACETGVAVGDIAAQMVKGQPWHGTIPEVTGADSTGIGVSLGRWLAHKHGRPFGLYRLITKRTPRSNVLIIQKR